MRRHETLAIGDRDVDVIAGKGARVLTCAFGRAGPGVDPDLEIQDFDELARRLRAPGR